MMQKDQGGTKELNGSWDPAQAVGTVNRHTIGTQYMSVSGV